MKCRHCEEALIACPQENHNCQGGAIHASDHTHECGWLDYLRRSREPRDGTPGEGAEG